MKEEVVDLKKKVINSAILVSSLMTLSLLATCAGVVVSTANDMAKEKEMRTQSVGKVYTSHLRKVNISDIACLAGSEYTTNPNSKWGSSMTCNEFQARYKDEIMQAREVREYRKGAVNEINDLKDANIDVCNQSDNRGVTVQFDGQATSSSNSSRCPP